MDRLLAVGGSYLNRWGFEKVQHPAVGVPLWVPFGIGLTQEKIGTGLKFSNKPTGVILTYDYYPSFNVRNSFESTKYNFARKGITVEYSTFRDDFFVFSFTDGITDGYIRYHQFDAGGLGFSLYWDHSAKDAHVERIAALISGSLWSAMSGSPFADPFTVALPGENAANSPPPPTPGPTVEEHSGPSSGTGEFITRDGLAITNAHVVKTCREIKASGEGTARTATVAAIDVTNDLALLRTNSTPSQVAALRSTVRLGENVEAFGYPLTKLLASSGNFTLGNVTALSGLRDDSRYFQISAPVQPGTPEVHS